MHRTVIFLCCWLWSLPAAVEQSSVVQAGDITIAYCPEIVYAEETWAVHLVAPMGDRWPADASVAGGTVTQHRTPSGHSELRVQVSLPRYADSALSRLHVQTEAGVQFTLRCWWPSQAVPAELVDTANGVFTASGERVCVGG